MNSWTDIFFYGPIGTVANSTVTFFQWLGSCMDGDCSATPADVTQILTGVGDNFTSTVAMLKSAGVELLLGIFNYLPDGGGFPDSFHSAFAYFGNALATIDFILPVSTLIYCIGFILAVKIALWSLHIIRTLISFIRGVSPERPNI